MRYVVYVDGFCKDNGRRGASSGGSFAVYVVPHDIDGEIVVDDALHSRLRLETPLRHDARFSVLAGSERGGRQTNNVAELASFATAMSWCVENGILVVGNEVHVLMDSMTTLGLLTGMSRPRRRALRETLRGVEGMMRRHGAEIGVDPETLVHLHWIPGTEMKASVIGH